MQSPLYLHGDPNKQHLHGIRLIPVIIAVFLLFGLMNAVSAAPTTAVHVVKYAADGTTVLNETTVTYEWMEANLPVQGDGRTHYFHQGPVFADDKEAQWDVNETTNFKDMGAVKGTAVRDLCDLVGGMSPDDEVMVKAGDGYHVEFPYANVYRPDSRQGTIAVCWFNGEESATGERQGTGSPPGYHTGMRLVILADTSANSAGKHVFGNQDMREVMPAEMVHLFDNLYPSTSGYAVMWVDEVRIYSGGYQGSKDSLPKSYQSKMDETYPAPLLPRPGLAINLSFLGCTFPLGASPKATEADPVVKNWQIYLKGTRENVITLDDLRKLPAVTGYGSMISTTGVRFGPYLCIGVDLRDLVALAGGMNPDQRIRISARDGYQWEFEADQLEGQGLVTLGPDLRERASPPLRLILVYEQDEKPVPYNDGGPFRIAIVSDDPGIITEGSFWVKWVDRIDIRGS
jgi:hypothetical protein